MFTVRVRVTNETHFDMSTSIRFETVPRTFDFRLLLRGVVGGKESVVILHVWL